MKFIETTFEEFLQAIHIELFPQILDDDLPNHFDNWLSIESQESIIEYAELFGKKQYLTGKDEILNK